MVVTTARYKPKSVNAYTAVNLCIPEAAATNERLEKHFKSIAKRTGE